MPYVPLEYMKTPQCRGWGKLRKIEDKASTSFTTTVELHKWCLFLNNAYWSSRNVTNMLVNWNCFISLTPWPLLTFSTLLLFLVRWPVQVQVPTSTLPSTLTWPRPKYHLAQKERALSIHLQTTIKKKFCDGKDASMSETALQGAT